MKFKPQDFIATTEVEVNTLLNLLSYSEVPPREYSRGIDCVAGFINVPLFGVNFFISDPLHYFLNKSFPYVLDGARRDEVVELLKYYPDLSLLLPRSELFKIVNSIFEKTCSKGYAVFLHGARSFSVDSKRRKEIYCKYIEKVAVALNSGDIAFSNEWVSNGNNSHKFSLKNFHSDWCRCKVPLDGSLGNFGEYFFRTFWQKFLSLNPNCELDMLLYHDAMKIIEVSDVLRNESQEYVVDKVEKYLREVYWNISRGGDMRDSLMSNCQENTKNCSENNVGNFSVNEKSLIDFESIDENSRVEDSFVFSVEHPGSSSDCRNEIVGNSGAGLVVNKSEVQTLTSGSDLKFNYLEKKEIASLMKIGVSTLNQYTNGHVEVHAAFPGSTQFGKKKVWRSDEVHEWIDGLRVWKQQRR